MDEGGHATRSGMEVLEIALQNHRKIKPRCISSTSVVPP